MKHEVIYAIVQFRPYTETEEFANVGVVLCAPTMGYFDFRLERKKFHRLTAFFTDLERQLPKRVTTYIAAELDRVKAFSCGLETKAITAIFHEVTKLKEGVICYSSTRVAFTDVAPQVKLDALFEHHVNHSFANKMSANQRLECATRQLLERHNLGHIYKAYDITDDDGLVKAAVPFAHQQDGQFCRVIRPLSLEFDTPPAIVDAGDKWIGRFKRLFDAKVLRPESVMMPLALADSADKQVSRAINTVFGDIERTGITPIRATDTEGLIQFASI